MVHRLIGREPGYGRHDSERVGRKEYHIGRVGSGAARQVVGNRVDRVAGTGVLGNAVGIEVYGSGDGIEHHVLQHRAEHLSGTVDLGLSLWPEPDDLGVAATLEVENPAVTP